MFKRVKTPILFFILFLLNIVLISLQVPAEGGESVFKCAFYKITSPLVYAVSGMKEFFHDTFSLLEDKKSLVEENKRLKREIFLLKSEKSLCKDIEMRNFFLKKLLKVREEFNLSGIVCEVVSRNFDIFSSTISIYLGKSSQLKSGFPVISSEGLVGFLLHKSGRLGEVELITNSGCAVSVVIEGKGIRGIAYGTGKDLLNVNYIPFGERVEKGDIFVTSGDDMMYPEGIPVGVVKKVSGGKELFQSVDIVPFVDFSRIEYVMVLEKSGEINFD